ncbi:MAG: polysaccharide biosynthesis protein [Clostridia bacterium]|nr:polysaccharide biosynthesis protein [Clostridia bacterium]MDD4376371.1 polysaccharide biosynthesis protein [Clostridia bacterium]
MEEFKDKVLLITGGTGSFGNQILKRFLDSDLKEIRIFSRDEKKQDDMRKKYNNEKIKFYIGDVRNYDSINRAMKGVDYVFHAAALKQVPSCEFYPYEATLTNIEGTHNAVEAAIANNVSKFVMLSTDKAVYPVNAMGISKAMAERIVRATARNLDDSKTTLCVTRYGNVMASRGSVIPLFVDQIKSGKDITVTDPEMTRFLMSLDEAVNLVIYAFTHAKQGDLFVQKADASTIQDLAIALCEMFDGDKNKVKVIGTRHGEKKHETLLSREEIVHAVDLGDYYSVANDNRNLNYKQMESGNEQITNVDEEYNSHNTKRLDVEGIKEKLMGIEYIRRALKNEEYLEY